ncbi:MAG: metalloregulator ArsR/SmtB family transcription factor [Desulforhopalus sp.]
MNEKAPMQILQLKDYALLLKALGEEARLKMIGLLQDGELCVCDIMKVLDLAQSTTSRHLAYLKNSGWVVARRSGKWMHYRLHPNIFSDPIQNAVIQQITGLPEVQTLREKLEIYLEKKSKSTTHCF